MCLEEDGLQVYKTLKQDAVTCRIPIIAVTAKEAEINRVLGMELGPDDHVTKPFRTRELVLRVDNLLRRTKLQACLPQGRLIRRNTTIFSSTRCRRREGAV